MLTGLPPHVADTPYEVASLVLTANVAPPSERNPEIWPELEQVMLKALSRNRADRYANAASFADALQDALQAHDIELSEPASAGAAPGVGSGEASDTNEPVEQPTIPLAGALLAGKSPRLPPSDHPHSAVPVSAAQDDDAQETQARVAPVVATGSPELRQPVRSEPLSLPVRKDDPQGAATSGTLLSGMTSAPPETARATSLDPLTQATDASGVDGGRRRRRWRSWVLALTVIVALGLLSALVTSTGATRLLPRLGFTATPALAADPTPTTTPTITPTSAPAATATLTAQQQLDRRASDSFRAITLAKARDNSCGSNATAFSAGNSLYINMCTSSHVAPGPVSVSIRQMDNLCTLPPDNNGGLTPSGSYYCYTAISLAAGSYDVVVTVTINGTPATARTLQFTVDG
jgi:hypothetical protein